MRLGGADGGHDAFAHTGDDGLFGCTADQAVDVGPHGHSSAGLQLNTVHGHGINGGLANIRVGAVDHSGVHRCANRIKDVSPRQVDGGRSIPSQIDPCFFGRDHGQHHVADPSPGQEVGFSQSVGMSMPAFLAVIRLTTMTRGLTFGTAS